MEQKENNAKITDKEIELFAHMILPEIKKFFADEKIKTEFEEWKAQQKNETNNENSSYNEWGAST